MLIIGAGVIGNAVARELSRYQLKIGILEKTPDIFYGTSGRNSAVLHAGFNNQTGSLMAKFCVAGNRGFDELARELDIPFKRTGKLVIGFTAEDRESLLKLKENGDANGVPGLEIVGGNRIQELAPAIGGETALWSPSTAIINSFQLNIGLAENAAKNGVAYFFNNRVTAVNYQNQLHTVTTDRATYQSRWVINCAGLGAAAISKMLGIGGYTIYPCRGEYFILDKKIGPLLPLPVYPVPNLKKGGLGIHLTPSIEGNILVGPSNEYIDCGEDYSVTREVMDLLIAEGSTIFPYLKKEYFIRNFAGIRPKLAPKSEGGYRDFVIERRADIAPYVINLIGIESPGLTSAGPISKEVVRLIREVEALKPNPRFDPLRRGIVTFHDKTPEEQADLIRRDPDYGEIICRCESITKAEVLAALRNSLGVATLTGIKYRCRAMMGRCQGGYCQTRLADLIMREKGITREEVLYNLKDSYLFTGTVRKG